MNSRGDWKEEGYEIIIGQPFVHSKGEEYIIDIYTKSGSEAGWFKIQRWNNHPVHGEILHVMEAEVMINHRRKGIATAVYSKMEELTGLKIHNEPDQQTPLAQFLWASTKKSFGK